MKITHMKSIGLSAILALLVCSFGAYAEETKEEMKGRADEAHSADSVDKQSEAFNICLRATQRFKQQEKTKGTGKTEVTSLSASCKTELKPVTYWLCMDKEANGKVDFNVAHTRCAKQTN
jgi:hypothetical protein